MCYVYMLRTSFLCNASDYNFSKQLDTSFKLNICPIRIGKRAAVGISKIFHWDGSLYELSGLLNKTRKQ